MKAFPKIFAIGTDYIRDIFKEAVEITEKIDGSQFGFGNLNGNVVIRIKGKQMFFENPEKMFLEAIEYIKLLSHDLPPNMFFYCEYLRKPKHNALVYSRIPKNHLMLFGVMDITERFINEHEALVVFADSLQIEPIPLLYQGFIHDPLTLNQILKRESILGGCEIEGVVIKNYTRQFLLGGQPMPLMAGKYISEKFKEVQQKKLATEHTGRGKWDLFKESYRTDARWRKEVQHLSEKGVLQNAPQDIGCLLKEIQKDIADEEKDNIKEFLWNEFGQEVLRHATKGFPEWYKQHLMERSFE